MILSINFLTAFETGTCAVTIWRLAEEKTKQKGKTKTEKLNKNNRIKMLQKPGKVKEATIC